MPRKRRGKYPILATSTPVNKCYILKQPIQIKIFQARPRRIRLALENKKLVHTLTAMIKLIKPGYHMPPSYLRHRSDMRTEAAGNRDHVNIYTAGMHAKLTRVRLRRHTVDIPAVMKKKKVYKVSEVHMERRIKHNSVIYFPVKLYQGPTTY